MSIHDEKLAFSDEDLEKYDCYGRTPPRTRLLRKYKEKKHRDKENFGVKASPKLTRRIVSRRNTVTTMFDELITKAENDADDAKRLPSNKRNMKLLRGAERDLKLDIGSAQMIAQENNVAKESVFLTVESCSRFKCLSSRRVASSGNKLRQIKPVSTPTGNNNVVEDFDCSANRIEFHQTLSMLIKMGSGDKPAPDRSSRRHISREEYLWQTELKDLIWLELQAYHADRTPMEQDDFLCAARESIGPLLNKIMCYKFTRHRSECQGCLSMYCEACMHAQNDGLREIEEILVQLEAAESLFPSSRAFGELFPLYVCPDFVGRVKAMCLWYNMTRHHRLKLLILGKLLALLENKDYQWPMQGDSVESTSPTDSNSSTNSVNDYLLNDKTPVDMYNVTPIVSLVGKRNDNTKSPYRKYIENILKTRGLSKSMSFLDKLHKHVLRKAQLTLEKPKDDSIFSEIPLDSEDDELRRYGCWSPEAQSLQLPSYKAWFLFLASVPLEVVYEFIRMRIEQKPKNPSPLSVRQLLRELKEGIKIALHQRECSTSYISTLQDECTKQYTMNIQIFDESLERLFADYLEYMSARALLEPEVFQKNFFEEEWNFICDNVTQISNGVDMAGSKFCAILGAMMSEIGKRLTTRVGEWVKAVDSKEEFYKKQNLFVVCRELQAVFNQERETSMKIIAFAKTLFRSGIPINNIKDFKAAVVSLKCSLPQTIEKVQGICDPTTLDNLDEPEKSAFVSRYREILMQGFRFGFEFHKELSDFVPVDRRELLAYSMVQFAQLWMKFAQERCERGRGKRPRWAYQGLDFLLTVCDPQYTRFLTDAEFEELKTSMDRCISHVIGTTAPSTPDSGFHTASPRVSLELVKFPRSRGSSPSTRPTYKSQRSAGRKTSVEQNSPISEVESPQFKCEDCLEDVIVKIQHSPALRAASIRTAVSVLDDHLDSKLRQQELIGKLVPQEPVGTASMKYLRKRNVTFSWQRGIKIGQGRFGKVYTAINNDTGEMMAVKEVAIQQFDVSVRKVTEEIKAMEGISHKNLVKYYGLEVHKDEMLIFMEFCPEGTLESLVAGTAYGLPELLTRRYTYQLVNGVAALHEHGIVHRDIKTANIFLGDEGNCLKIGDFGCAVKLKSHVTMPGELIGTIGTQAYMAPEMFTKTTIDGHGRAADIWSIGCVVVEMSSGKRPWSKFDSNFQIMFKVGMGEIPEAPSTLIDEGHDFLDICFQHDPRKRATALELLTHNFVAIGDDF